MYRLPSDMLLLVAVVSLFVSSLELSQPLQQSDHAVSWSSLQAIVGQVEEGMAAEVQALMDRFTEDLQAAQGELHAVTDKLHETQDKLESVNLELEQSNEPATSINVGQENERQLFTRESNCFLGSKFGFHEYIDTLGQGTFMSLGENSGGPYECLYQCYANASCVGVNMNTDSRACMGLSSVDTMSNMTDMNFYEIAFPDECYVDDMPSVMFQATITTDKNYGTGQKVAWDTLRANPTTELEADTTFHCPIDGTYSFVLDAQTNSATASNTINLDIMHEGVTVKRQHASHSNYNAFISSSSTAYITCMAGETVWVESFGNSHLEGTSWQTSFAGLLLSTRIA